MKKLIIASVCLLMCLVVKAQGFEGAPQYGQRQGGMMGFMNVNVIDTAIVNSIELPADVLEKVLVLKTQQDEEAKAFMEANKPEQGRRMSREDRQARRQLVAEQKAKFRKELRAVIGDEKYISYLEKQVDRGNRMGGQRPGGQRPGGGQRPNGGWGGQGGQNGDFNNF